MPATGTAAAATERRLASSSSRGFWPGIAAGALVGGAIANSYAYYGDPYYGNGYYDDGYYDDSTVAVVPGGGGDDAGYCAQRYRSYDPASGTYSAMTASGIPARKAEPLFDAFRERRIAMRRSFHCARKASATPPSATLSAMSTGHGAAGIPDTGRSSQEAQPERNCRNATRQCILPCRHV
jgi:hypothetical protein